MFTLMITKQRMLSELSRIMSWEYRDYSARFVYELGMFCNKSLNNNYLAPLVEWYFAMP